MPVPGWDQDFVYAADDVIERGLRFDGRVVVLDEESITTAPGIAEMLTQSGSRVTVVTRWLHPFYRLHSQIVTVEIPRLKRLGVEVATSTHVRRIGDHQVTLYDVDTGEEREMLDVAAVVVATGRRADLNLGKALQGKAAQVFSIGDALSPRGLSEAVQEGHRYARLLGEPEAPRNFTELYFAPVDFSLSQRPALALLKEPAAV
jgi:pyruvate/2-oxoglutarate dehydrogenase complex dihydrolipoamide dehydrogenase (E3) component